MSCLEEAERGETAAHQRQHRLHMECCLAECD